MITYEYICDNCGDNFEILQNIRDDALVKCDKCNKDSLRRVFFPVIGFVTGGSNMTLGSLADKNTTKLSDEAKHHILTKDRPKENEEKSLPKGMKAVPKQPYKKPFWENPQTCPATQSEINKMTDAQKKKYIETGKKS